MLVHASGASGASGERGHLFLEMVKIGYSRGRLVSTWKALALKLLKRSRSKYSVFKKKRKTLLRNRAYRGSYKKYYRH